MTEDERYMKEAIKQAKKAYALDEVPIGCVIVQDNKIIARGYNRRNTDKNALAHAEISAIKKASKKTGDWRLEDCTMYVTLEPCQMCAGAIVQSRMKKVVIGAMNHRFDSYRRRSFLAVMKIVSLPLFLCRIAISVTNLSPIHIFWSVTQRD